MILPSLLEIARLQGRRRTLDPRPACPARRFDNGDRRSRRMPRLSKRSEPTETVTQVAQPAGIGTAGAMTHRRLVR